MRSARRLTRIIAVAAVSVLSGCVAQRVDYYKLRVPNALYFKDECYGAAGPPSLAYYPYKGIFISLDTPSRAFFELGLHVPASTVAALMGNSVSIAGVTADGRAVTVTAVLKAVPHGSFGTNEPRHPFLWRPDPYKSPLGYGPLKGGTFRGEYLWYLFEAFPQHDKELPTDLVRGSITLPPIKVGKHGYPSEVVTFGVQKVTGIIPVNC